MKQFTLIFLLAMVHVFPVSAQETKDDYSKRVQSLDNIIATLYAVISGEKGEPRDWDLMRHLFHPDAKLIPTGKTKEGIHKARFMTVENYIKTSGPWLIQNGFFENEIHRKVEIFGNIAHVFSTYESFHSMEETEPFMRGINSIQLLNDADRWWIINIYWSQESDLNPIPSQYLPSK